MRYVLDTHVLLWWLADSPKLLPEHRALIANQTNTALVSSISVAEISLKSSLGKLESKELTDEFLIAEGFTPLPFDTSHAAALRDLPWHHRDPFDRMLIAQCVVEQTPLLTVDEPIRRYAIETR